MWTRIFCLFVLLSLHSNLVAGDPDPKKLLDLMKSLGTAQMIGVATSETQVKAANAGDDAAKKAAAKLLKNGTDAGADMMKVSASACLLSAAKAVVHGDKDIVLTVLVKKPQPIEKLNKTLGVEDRVHKDSVTFRGTHVHQWREFGWIRFGVSAGNIVAVRATAGAIVEHWQTKPVAPPAEAKPVAPEDPEKAAERRLKFAKGLLADKLTEKAKDRLEEMVRAYPKTKAAEEARALLKEMVM